MISQCPFVIASWFSGSQLLIVLGIVLLLFGANRLPELMRSLGRSVTELKKGITEGGNAVKRLSGLDRFFLVVFVLWTLVLIVAIAANQFR